MALSDLLRFENPEVVALALGILAFVLTFVVLTRLMDRGPSAIISIVIGIIAGWYLYTEDYLFNIEGKLLAVFLILAVVGVAAKIAWTFIKSGKKQFRR